MHVFAILNAEVVYGLKIIEGSLTISSGHDYGWLVCHIFGLAKVRLNLLIVNCHVCAVVIDYIWRIEQECHGECLYVIYGIWLLGYIYISWT